MELLNLAMEGVKVLSGNNTAHLAYRSLASELPQEMRGLYLVDEPHQKQEVPRDAAQQEQPLYKIRVPLASAAVAASAQGANASEPVPGIQQLPTLLRGLDKLAARASINTFAQFNKAVTDIRDIIHRQEFQAQLTWHAELDNKLEAISRLENVRDNPALHECILGLKTQG
jgi:hypothetical protein